MSLHKNTWKERRKVHVPVPNQQQQTHSSRTRQHGSVPVNKGELYYLQQLESSTAENLRGAYTKQMLSEQSNVSIPGAPRNPGSAGNNASA